MTIITAEVFVIELYVQIATGHQTGVFFYIRKILGHGWPDSGIHNRPVLNEFTMLKAVVSDAIGTTQLLIEIVVAQLKTHKLKYEKTCCQPNGQHKNVDGRKNFVLGH